MRNSKARVEERERRGVEVGEGEAIVRNVFVSRSKKDKRRTSKWLVTTLKTIKPGSSAKNSTAPERPSIPGGSCEARLAEKLWNVAGTREHELH